MRNHSITATVHNGGFPPCLRQYVNYSTVNTDQFKGGKGTDLVKQEGNGPIDERHSLNLASDLKSVNSITCISMFIWSLMVASEATTASKQPQRSNLTSELKSVTSITCVSISICAVIALISKMTRRRRHLPPIDFAVAIAPLVKIHFGHVPPCI